MSTTIYYGAVVNPRSLQAYDLWPRCLLAVNAKGVIDWVVEDVQPHELQDALASKGHSLETDFVALKDGEFLIPGFVDTHTHAPQVPNMGTGGQYQLLDWLQNVTFPMEAKFKDVSFAKTTYESVVRRIIDSGTTTCCYYGTLHLEATKALADIIHSFGQRAFVGKCNMNRESPAYYVEPTAAASVDATKELINYIRNLSPAVSKEEQLVQPILTPRFAISCTDELLESLGNVAKADPQLRIQTHISENLSEIAFTKSLFPKASSYAGVYDMFGLLRDNTVLAHAVHLSEDEVNLIKERKAGISHCPTSNFNLSSGVAPVGYYLDKGIKVGLGTDVSGGFNISILNAIQNASIASKVCSFNPKERPDVPAPVLTDKALPIATLFYLATMGGASVCGLEDQIGSMTAGKSFDALLVTVQNNAGNPGIWGIETFEQAEDVESKVQLDGWFERFLFGGDDRNIRVAQLATTDSNALHRPRVRSIIVRAAISSPSNPQLPLLIGSTDIRTPKVTQLGNSSKAEISWWVDPAQHQFRIGADVYWVPQPDHELYPKFSASLANAKDGTGLALFKAYDWEAKRIEIFRMMSPGMKAAWCRPPPGSKLEGGEEEAKKWPAQLFDPDDPESNIPSDQYEEAKRNWNFALKNFALLLFDPIDIDVVDLASRPNTRIFHAKNPNEHNEIWKQEDLVP
ncbi:hypothetical protein CVT24_006777 [Panaeolus cyanescens]|uniref:Probable guanine deaminase n=1 Tax=Panaeolus cyanescens TaxID=181874 RepID=A0A409V9A7_9AGAR|nr:hypothetical protein CVT24_006777 [Panaeolus cyanescens]